MNTLSSVSAVVWSTKQSLPPPAMHYKFDTGDVSGNLLKNYATGTNDATINGPVLDTTVRKVGVSSMKNISNGNIVTLPSITLPAPSIGFSISTWVNTSTGGYTGGWFGFSIGSTQEICLYTAQATATWGVYIQSASGIGTYCQSNANSSFVTTWNANTWYHLVVVFSNLPPKVYINTVQIVVSTTPNTPMTNPYVAGTYTTNYLFRSPLLASGASNLCNLDDFRVYNSKLTPTDIAALYALAT